MSIYHDQANEALLKLKASTAPSFREALNDCVAGWQSSCGDAGYGDPRHHTNLPVGRAMYDVLPAPFNSVPYNWRDSMGFNPVLSYADQATKEAVAALLDAAIVRNNVIAND